MSRSEDSEAPDTAEQADVASRARSYAPVALDSTDSFEERASARRFRAGELESRIPAAPAFRFGPPSGELLDRLVRDYVEITSDPVRGPRNNKRNLIAACYRVHGDDFGPLVRDIFRVEGTAQNLLGVIRQAEPRLGHGYPDEPDEVDLLAPIAEHLVENRADRHTGPPCPAEACLPNLIYCAGHRPPFDSTSTRRWDRPRTGASSLGAADGDPK